MVTALLLIPIASSQVVSRWLLRDVKQPLARGLRHAADFVTWLESNSVDDFAGFRIGGTAGAGRCMVRGGNSAGNIHDSFLLVGVLVRVYPRDQESHF